MGILATALRSFVLGEKWTRDPTLSLYFGSGPTASGANVTEWTAMNYSAFWGAVNIISNSVATLPLVLYKRLPAGGREEFLDHPLYWILHHQFNPETTSIKARQTMQAHVLTWGNAYALIERDQVDRTLALWPITPDRVTPDRNRVGNVIYRVQNPSGTEAIVPADDMLHLAGPGWDPLVGYSVIRKAREEIGVGMAAQKYGAQFFDNGAVSSLAVTHPGTLSKKAQDNLRDSINATISGEKKHGVLILEEGMKGERTSIPPDDAQFIETFRMTTLWICQRFNLPPHMLAELERATFSNIEHQAIEFVQYCLLPHLVMWEAEILRKLIRPAERKIQYVKHTVDALLRGDALSRAQALEIRWRNGTLSADEWRSLEEDNPIPNGDGKAYYVPLNMVKVDRVDDIIDKQVEPTPKPIAAPALTSSNGNGERAHVDPGKMIAALRLNFEDRMSQMVRREAQAARRAAKKGAKEFREWREGFYPKHASVLRDALLPPMQAHLIFVAATIGSQEATRKLVEEYIADSQSQLDALPTEELENAVDLLMTRWETQRPPAVADTLMTEELGHAIADSQ